METLSSSIEQQQRRQYNNNHSNSLETSGSRADSPPSFGINWRNHHSVSSNTPGTTTPTTIGLSNHNNNHNSSKCNNKTKILSSSSDDEDEDGYNHVGGSEKRKSRLKKCSSLKSTKSTGAECNNGSGHGKISKKIVRFADVLGLDLERVKTFMDEIPKVPPSAFKDLSLATELNNAFSLNCTISSQALPLKPKQTSADDRIILPNFHQPFTQTNFYQQLHEKRVMLETAYSDNSNYIIGTIRVVNVGFEKAVYVRYSQDDWVSSQEIQALYNATCHDVTTDKFNFSLFINNRLSFCLRYTVNGQEYWDNNNGANYSFNSIPNAVPSAPNLYNNQTAAVYNQVHW